MRISHFMYKVDDLHKAVHDFEKMGFNVTFGKKKNPYNALIYFQDGSYIELIENMNMNIAVKIILRLIGKKKFAEGLEIHDKAPEGFIRFSFHAHDKSELQAVKNIFREVQHNTSAVTVGRKDLFGNKLSCHCVFPFDHNLPFFNTTLKGGDDLWKTEHPNKIIGIKEIHYSTSKEYYSIIERFDPEEKLIISVGNDGVTKIEFVYSEEPSASLVFDKIWRDNNAH